MQTPFSKGWLRALAWLAAGCLALPAALRAQDVNTLLQAADRYRMGAENLQIETQVSVRNADGSPDKERRYRVFAQAQRQSLVLMQSPAEKGQKVLMLGDDFWLLMPESQRPLRITPMQKLLGDASTGDIATMAWAGDYAATLLGTEPCDSDASTTRSCWHLSLKAQRSGVSYQRIELWLGRAHGEPLRADLYVLSDKLAKQARFLMDRPEAPTMVTEMVLSDQVSNHKTTHVRYLSRQERRIPPEWLNPMFLVRNPALD